VLQALCPLVVPYVPAAHDWQPRSTTQSPEAPAPDCVAYVLAGHFSQVCWEVAAVAAENFPGAQAVQRPEAMNPEPVPYVPAAQGVHRDARLEPGVVENVPAVQGWHAVVPGRVENVPALHVAHVVSWLAEL